MNKRIAAIGATVAIMAPASGVALAESAAAYSVPTRVHYGQPCTPGHNEGITPNRTEIIYDGATSLTCYYKVRKYKLWTLMSVSYISLDKIVKRCPGAPIRMAC